MNFDSAYIWIMFLSVGFNIVMPVVLLALFVVLFKITKRPAIFALAFPMIYQLTLYIIYSCYVHKPITLCNMPVDDTFFQIGFRILIALNGISLAIYCLAEIVSIRIRKRQYNEIINGSGIVENGP